MGAGRPEELTKNNEYEPTPAEERLIQALANPENVGLSITDICKLADISRTLYYEAFKKPEFVAYHDRLCKDMVKQSLTPVVNAFIREAKAGSFQHGKVLLEMAGIYTQKQNHELTGKDGGPIETRIVVDLPDELK